MNSEDDNRMTFGDAVCSDCCNLGATNQKGDSCLASSTGERDIDLNLRSQREKDSFNDDVQIMADHFMSTFKLDPLDSANEEYILGDLSLEDTEPLFELDDCVVIKNNHLVNKCESVKVYVVIGIVAVAEDNDLAGFREELALKTGWYYKLSPHCEDDTYMNSDLVLFHEDRLELDLGYASDDDDEMLDDCEEGE